MSYIPYIYNMHFLMKSPHLPKHRRPKYHFSGTSSLKKKPPSQPPCPSDLVHLLYTTVIMIFPGQDSPQPIEHAQIPRLALKPFHRLSLNQAPGYIAYYSTKYKLQSREEQFLFTELLLHTHPALFNSWDKSSHLFFSFIPYNCPAREPFSFFYIYLEMRKLKPKMIR